MKSVSAASAGLWGNLEVLFGKIGLGSLESPHWEASNSVFLWAGARCSTRLALQVQQPKGYSSLNQQPIVPLCWDWAICLTIPWGPGAKPDLSIPLLVTAVAGCRTSLKRPRTKAGASFQDEIDKNTGYKIRYRHSSTHPALCYCTLAWSRVWADNFLPS